LDKKYSRHVLESFPQCGFLYMNAVETLPDTYLALEKSRYINSNSSNN
jgi:hypothetical protein